MTFVVRSRYGREWSGQNVRRAFTFLVRNVISYCFPIPGVPVLLNPHNFTVRAVVSALSVCLKPWLHASTQIDYLHVPLNYPRRTSAVFPCSNTNFFGVSLCTDLNRMQKCERCLKPRSKATCFTGSPESSNCRAITIRRSLSHRCGGCPKVR